MKASISIVLGCLIFFLVTACDEGQQPVHTGQEVADTQPTQNGKVVLHLYFADQKGAYLTAEDMVVARPDGTKALAIAIIEALVDGPQKALTRTIPQGTALRAFHLVENGTAYVDLSKEIKENHPGGARSELMTIYSLVNSIVLNMPEVAAVKLLIDGQEEATLAGHIDLRYPFKANMLLIR